MLELELKHSTALQTTAPETLLWLEPAHSHTGLGVVAKTTLSKPGGNMLGVSCCDVLAFP